MRTFVFVALVLALVSGTFGQRSCLSPWTEPGCTEDRCATLVCTGAVDDLTIPYGDPECCSKAWDRVCVGLAHRHCTFLTHPEPPPLPAGPVCPSASADQFCLEPAGSPGCSDTSCCQRVCKLRPRCCDAEGCWDRRCAQIAQRECSELQPAAPVCKFSDSPCIFDFDAGLKPTGEGSCSYKPCCTEVLKRNRFCATYYDRECSDQAAELLECTHDQLYISFLGEGDPDTYTDDAQAHNAAVFALSRAYPGIVGSSFLSASPAPAQPNAPEALYADFLALATDPSAFNQIIEDSRNGVLRGLLPQMFIGIRLPQLHLALCGAGWPGKFIPDKLDKAVAPMTTAEWSADGRCVNAVLTVDRSLRNAFFVIRNNMDILRSAFPPSFCLNWMELAGHQWPIDPQEPCPPAGQNASNRNRKATWDAQATASHQALERFAQKLKLVEE